MLECLAVLRCDDGEVWKLLTFASSVQASPLPSLVAVAPVGEEGSMANRFVS